MTTITLTDSAAEHARTYVAKDARAVGLRVGVRPTGCSGYAYDIDYAHDTSADDTVFEQHGVRIVIDRRSLPVLDGVEIDYVRNGVNRSFKFTNPNISGECGCGESFTV